MISCNLQGIWCWKLARCFPFTWPCAVTSDLPEGETQTWRSMCMCGKLTWTLTPTPQPKDVTEHIRVFKNVHDYWRGFPPAGSNKLTGSWYLFLLSYNYIIIHIYIYIYIPFISTILIPCVFQCCQHVNPFGRSPEKGLWTVESSATKKVVVATNMKLWLATCNYDK